MAHHAGRNKIRLVNNLRPTLSECRQFTIELNRRRRRIVSTRLLVLKGHAFLIKALDDIIKFSFWINVVSIGAVIGMFSSVSQVIFYKDCESYFMATKYIENILSISKLYILLISYPFWAVSMFYATIIIMSVFVFFFPSYRMVKMFKSDFGIDFSLLAKTVPAGIGAASIVLWFYVFAQIMPEVIKEYSLERVNHYHKMAASMCKSAEGQ